MELFRSSSWHMYWLTLNSTTEKQHVLELFKLKGKNPQINCNFRMSDNEFPKTLDPERIRYLKSLNPKLESSLGPKCDLNLPYICDNCLHRVLHGKFSSWTSGNELIDSFIQETQLFSPYERYPEWVPYNSLSQIKKIGEGGFGTVFSAMWSWGIKSSLEEDDKDDKKGGKDDKTRKKVYHYRTGPCTVALKKLKGEMKFTQTFLLEVQAQFDFCHLYGITQDPSTLEYMFIMRFAPQGDLRRYLLRNFDNLILPNKLGIAQTICAELEKIHAKGWVHVYNDIIKMCWDPDPSKRPSASEILISIERLCEFRQPKDIQNYPKSGFLLEHGNNFFNHIPEFSNSNGYGLIKYFESEIHQQLKIAHKACRIYIKMKWKPNKPIHSEAVYTSRSFSYKSLQDEIDILLVKSNRSSIVG
ncbi:unnamed protein product [Rhizophagus irregularis]|nr:unnamed protein product [Rhizophagus irregularis]